jgi:hypothetical protein
MALVSTKYEAANLSLGQGLFAFLSDTIKCMLLDTYTPDTSPTGHQFLDDVLAAGTEAAGTGYVAGGVTVGSKTWAYVGANSRWELHGDIPAWDTTGGSLDGAYAVFYKATGTNSTSPLLGVWNLDGAGGVQTSSNGSFDLNENPDGIFYLD